jgi:hypothetical protein
LECSGGSSCGCAPVCQVEIRKTEMMPG